ncbi:MAG: glycoside hydrolase family 43 protein [Planctomycetota bacterium]
MPATIQNPVLTGFNPDPSILRVGDDYYIATSTFEWFPGVQIHHSRDLVHWRLLTRPLDRVSQLDMRGVGDSCGVWAPCLSHDPKTGVFHLIYTVVRNRGHFKDTPNFLVTAETIDGPWSEPVFLNASGFDPSLFHDDDGRKWLVNMVWDARADKNPFAGIFLQEYDPAQRKLIGPIKNIFRGTHLGLVEGPHLYRRKGWYYLLTAEGGTMHEHAVTLARSRSIDGPYEVHPDNPVLTADGKDHLPLRKAGHGSLVETPDGRWWLAHLCGRPVSPSGRCVLGRETAIQEVRWDDDGWLRLVQGGNTPELNVPGPDLPPHAFVEPETRDDFDGDRLGLDYQTLRIPLADDLCNVTERPSYLRLRGGESLASVYEQSHVARRIQHHTCTVETRVDFDPQHFQHAAGLTAYYDTRSFYFLAITHDETVGRCLALYGMDAGEYHEYHGQPIPLPDDSPCDLRLQLNQGELQFSYRHGGQAWTRVGPTLDASILSDEYAQELGFTGAFAGMACLDLAGTRRPADFDHFSYQPIRTTVPGVTPTRRQPTLNPA